MLNKILRAVIGLPFVLVFWSVAAPMSLIVWAMLWLFDGNRTSWMVESDNKCVQRFLVLPVSFLRKVWKD